MLNAPRWHSLEMSDNSGSKCKKCKWKNVRSGAHFMSNSEFLVWVYGSVRIRRGPIHIGKYIFTFHVNFYIFSAFIVCCHTVIWPECWLTSFKDKTFWKMVRTDARVWCSFLALINWIINTIEVRYREASKARLGNHICFWSICLTGLLAVSHIVDGPLLWRE